MKLPTKIKLNFTNQKKEKLILIFLILIFIVIRSFNFPQRLDFATDQATSSSAVLQMIRTHRPVLIGPRFTLEYKARYMFFGPAPYYFQTPFLILGNFDPIISSYLFMIFSSLMIIPLFYGVKKLINLNSAILMAILYTLFPFFVNYSGFLWNPNSQFVLLPVLVWLMGCFKQSPTKSNFFLVSIFAGILLEFHYIFILIIFGLIIFYFRIKKLKLSFLPIFLGGLFLGMSPLVLFEFRNQFYNTKTLIIFIEHWREVLPTPGSVSSGDPHYFLPFAFFGILSFIFIIRRFINLNVLMSAFIILFIWCLFLYFPKPTHAYGMVNNWNYLDEVKAHEIIKSQNITNYNVVNLGYDTIAEVQKYLLKKDNISINYYDYWYNNYLFVITSKSNFLSDPAYEVKNINPAQVIKSWDINAVYKLYLVKKIQ